MSQNSENISGSWDLYMIGVYRSVLEEILGVHHHLPNQILYMQPHGPRPIRQLRDDPPTTRRPANYRQTHQNVDISG